MGSYLYREELKLIEDEEYSKQMETIGYDFYDNAPEVKLIKEGETYLRNGFFDWVDEVVEVKRGHRIYDFGTYWCYEIRVIDEDGNITWMDGPKVPYDECWEGLNLQYYRPKEYCYIDVYDGKEKIVKKYKCLLDSTKPITKDEMKKKFNQDVINDELLTQNDANNMERNNAISNSQFDDINKAVFAFLILPDNLRNDKEIICAFFSFKKEDLAKYSDNLWNDIEFVRLMSNKHLRLLECASEEVRSNKDLISELMEKKFKPYTSHVCALDYASAILKDDKEFVLPYIKVAGYLLKRVSDRLKKDDDVCVAAMRNCLDMMRYANGGQSFIDAWNKQELTKEDFTSEEAAEKYEEYLNRMKNYKKK